MSTQNPKFQVGDVIRCDATVRTIASVNTTGLSPRGRGDWYTFVPVPGSADGYGGPNACDAADGELSIGYIDDWYTLVERPRDTNREEVKDVSNFKFKVGDIIRNIDDPEVVRVVLSVDPDASYDHYRISYNLDDVSPRDANQSLDESQDVLERWYEVLVPAPAATNVTDAHEADIRTLSTMLATEARTRGWCSEYGTVIDRFNENLTVKLEPFPAVNVRTTATITMVLERTDEISNDQAVADHAYNQAYSVSGTNVTPPAGWVIQSLRTTAYNGAAV